MSFDAFRSVACRRRVYSCREIIIKRKVSFFCPTLYVLCVVRAMYSHRKVDIYIYYINSHRKQGREETKLFHAGKTFATDILAWSMHIHISTYKRCIVNCKLLLKPSNIIQKRHKIIISNFLIYTGRILIAICVHVNTIVTEEIHLETRKYET